MRFMPSVITVMWTGAGCMISAFERGGILAASICVRDVARLMGTSSYVWREYRDIMVHCFIHDGESREGAPLA
jgi:hypothetical protein